MPTFGMRESLSLPSPVSIPTRVGAAAEEGDQLDAALPAG